MADYQKPKPRDAPYTPTTLVGARLPHAPVTVRQPGRLLAASGGHHVASTIDLPAEAGTSLLLLLSEGDAVGSWEAAAAAAEAATGVPILPVVISRSPHAGGSSTGSSSAAEGSTVVHDSEGAWLALRQLPADGALLVRPDGHIAWRRPTAAGDLAAELGAAVRAVMCL